MITLLIDIRDCFNIPTIPTMFQQSNNSNVDPQIEGTSHNRNHVMIGNKDLDTAAVVDDNKNNDFDIAVNDNDAFDNSPANVVVTGDVSPEPFPLLTRIRDSRVATPLNCSRAGSSIS